MTNVLFKRGKRANLPAAVANGTFYVATDERAIYVDVDDSTRVRIGDFQEFPTLAELKANVNPTTTALYYVTELNCLAKWNGSDYVQINLDTGATGVEITGSGNAVDGVSYDPATRKLTFTKSNTFVTVDEVETVKASVAAVEAKVSALVGTDTSKSVRSIAAEELAKQLIPEDAQDSLDTLAEIAAWIQSHPDDVAAINKAISDLETLVGTLPGDAESATVVDYIKECVKDVSDALEERIAAFEESNHSHANKDELDKIEAGDKAKWDSSEANAKAYADSLATNYDPKGAASTAETNAKSYADGLAVNYDTAGAATTAETNAKAYADSLATNYESAGAASTAEANAKKYADSLADNYEAAGAATTAEQNAKEYADGLAKNYEVAGAATKAETNAKSYADSLAGNYEVAGAAGEAETKAKAYADSLADNYEVAGAASQAETNAKTYADSLASNYETAGAAATAESNAKAYVDSMLTWGEF